MEGHGGNSGGELTPLQRHVALVLAREKLREAVKQLLARYPRVRIVEADVAAPAGLLQQTLRFRASIAELRGAGLVTANMLSHPDDAFGYFGLTSLGDAFALRRTLDAKSQPGSWDLVVFTGAVPREQAHFALHEAKRLIARIASKR